MYSLQKSLNFGQYVPNDKVLNRKVPENPRYKHVKPAVDTGKNVKRQIDELKEKQKSLNHKKDEVFNRIKFSAFIKLAFHVAKEQLQERDEASKTNGKDEFEAHKSDSKIANVLIGIGEIDLRNEKLKPAVIKPKVEKTVPYLLLDVRDRDEFLKCHIKTAKHYPAAMLSRSNCYELEEMKLYKNNRPELIVICDEDESIASRVATTLVQRGYENIFVLTGGLKLGHDFFPHALMTAITTSDTTSSCPTSTVQFKSSTTEYFTQEDIDRIQQYIEDCPRKSTIPVRGSKSSVTHSKSSKASLSVSKSAEFSNSPFKQGSLTYRKDSASSSKSMERVQLQDNNSSKYGEQAQLRMGSRCSTAEGHSKNIKKAPWK